MLQGEKTITERENIFANYISDKGVVYRIHKDLLNSIIKKTLI